MVKSSAGNLTAKMWRLSRRKIIPLQKRILMDTKYKHIRPADIYVSLFPEQPAEDAPQPNEWGNLPSGNDFIDLFAGLIRKHGYRPVMFYAQQMGVPKRLMPSTILALSGLQAREWIHEYLILEVCEMVEKTDLQFKEIGERFHLSPVSFSRFFQLMRKCQPFEWRNGRKRES